MRFGFTFKNISKIRNITKEGNCRCCKTQNTSVIHKQSITKTVYFIFFRIFEIVFQSKPRERRRLIIFFCLSSGSYLSNWRKRLEIYSRAVLKSDFARSKTSVAISLLIPLVLSSNSIDLLLFPFLCLLSVNCLAKSSSLRNFSSMSFFKVSEISSSKYFFFAK